MILLKRFFIFVFNFQYCVPTLHIVTDYSITKLSMKFNTLWSFTFDHHTLYDTLYLTANSHFSSTIWKISRADVLIIIKASAWLSHFGLDYICTLIFQINEFHQNNSNRNSVFLTFSRHFSIKTVG
jgi:hypothetical protein